MTLVLDAGAFVAVERNDRHVMALLKHALVQRQSLTTHAGVVGQVWRGGRGRQVDVARLLPAVDVQALDDALGRRVGMLLGAARRDDVVDAALVLLANDGDDIVTSDSSDLVDLARVAGIHLELLPV